MRAERNPRISPAPPVSRICFALATEGCFHSKHRSHSRSQQHGRPTLNRAERRRYSVIDVVDFPRFSMTSRVICDATINDYPITTRDVAELEQNQGQIRTNARPLALRAVASWGYVPFAALTPLHPRLNNSAASPLPLSAAGKHVLPLSPRWTNSN